MILDARRIWAILVNHAGAHDSDSAWVEFRQWFDRDHAGSDEFRFMGSLGFGGKFWLNRHGEMFVTCYPEDRTPERNSIVARVNEELRRATGEAEAR